MTLGFTDESKEILKKYIKLLNKITDLIRSVKNISNNHDKKYMKIKFNGCHGLMQNALYAMVVMI